MARRITDFGAACEPSNPVLIHDPGIAEQGTDLRPAAADGPQHRAQHHPGKHQECGQRPTIAAISDGANESTKACSARTFNV